jgi:hypothetical protein
MLLRIVAITAVIAVLMGVLAQGDLLERSGIVGRCEAVGAPTGDEGVWQGCRAGKLEGRPDLRLESCVSHGVRQGIEYWRCPAPIVAGRASQG